MDLICLVQTSLCKSGQDLVAAFLVVILHHIGWVSTTNLVESNLSACSFRSRIASPPACYRRLLQSLGPFAPKVSRECRREYPRNRVSKGVSHGLSGATLSGHFLHPGAPQHPHPSPPRNYKFGLLVGFVQKIHEKGQNAQDFVNPLFLCECTENAFSNFGGAGVQI